MVSVHKISVSVGVEKALIKKKYFDDDALGRLSRDRRVDSIIVLHVFYFYLFYFFLSLCPRHHDVLTKQGLRQPCGKRAWDSSWVGLTNQRT